MQSVKHHVLTTSGSVAQKPDYSYLIDTTVRLCHPPIHSSPKKKDPGTVSKWDLILDSYRKSRWYLLVNEVVMAKTNKHLVEVSSITVVQWYNKKYRTKPAQLLTPFLYHRQTDKHAQIHIYNGKLIYIDTKRKKGENN